MKHENWYIFYTRPQSESMAYRELVNKYEECFLPKKKIIKQWKDRRKSMEVPLFPSYLFVKTAPSKIYHISASKYIVSAIRFGNQYAIIQDQEIDKIKRVMSHQNVLDVQQDLAVGDEVRVIDGPLMGMEGILYRQNSEQRFALNISCIKQSLIVDIQASQIEKISNSTHIMA